MDCCLWAFGFADNVVDLFGSDIFMTASFENFNAFFLLPPLMYFLHFEVGDSEVGCAVDFLVDLFSPLILEFMDLDWADFYKRYCFDDFGILLILSLYWRIVIF